MVKLVGTTCTVHVVLSVDKYRQIAEVSVKTKTLNLVARCEAATEMTVALHDALVKIEQQGDPAEAEVYDDQTASEGG